MDCLTTTTANRYGAEQSYPSTLTEEDELNSVETKEAIYAMTIAAKDEEINDLKARLAVVTFNFMQQKLMSQQDLSINAELRKRVSELQTLSKALHNENKKLAKENETLFKKLTFFEAQDKLMASIESNLLYEKTIAKLVDESKELKTQIRALSLKSGSPPIDN